ncbi:hypothetical protein [Dictyobacter formicarum]|uniref:CopC domain-containing protein n=1 Tax=Dictyobacter formicarum TaxID=2778368 RepID=A0ABQ3VBH5_9CHLR|nr:hypothetical protein [Dictyobacter formicarum]GHO82561.1 hypothetical protein KSZ_05670 [Dictyobacter formicarum]
MNIRPQWSFCIQTPAITKLCIALLLACWVLLAFPDNSFAHAVLIRSDPAQGAVLRVFSHFSMLFRDIRAGKHLPSRDGTT